MKIYEFPDIEPIRGQLNFFEVSLEVVASLSGL